MGKGEIVSGGPGGLYTINIIYSTESYDAEISALNAKITDLTNKYNAFPLDLTDSQKKEKNIILLSKIAMEKRKKYLEDNFNSTKTVSAWCSDLTENLSGQIGTIEVPGESQYINIRPGYADAAAYNGTRDGQLQQTITMDYAGAFYNIAMLPGWQKWKPTYRYGTITNLVGGNASISLELITSTQQSLNVNQSYVLDNVSVEYMNCNEKAFTVGDQVLIKFDGQDWANPKIIGFKDNPKPCGVLIKLLSGSQIIIFDPELDAISTNIPLDSDPSSTASFPCDESEISNWLSNFAIEKNPPISDVTLSRFDLYENHPYITCSGYEPWEGPDCWGETLDCDDTGTDPVPWTYQKDVYSIQDEFRAKRDTDISKTVEERGLTTKSLISSSETKTAYIDRTEVYSEEYMFCAVDAPDPCGFCGETPTYYEYCLETNEKTFIVKSPFSTEELTYVLTNTGSSTEVFYSDFTCIVLQEEEELEVLYGIDSASGSDEENPYMVVIFNRKISSNYRSREAGKFPSQLNDIYYGCRASQQPFLTPEPAPSWSTWSGTAIEERVSVYMGQASEGIAGETLDPFNLPENGSLKNAINLFSSPNGATVSFLV